MCVAVGGIVDAIVYTGGMAYSKTFTDMVSEKVSFLAPIEIYPGENEMAALADGGLRVIKGEEVAKEYVAIPKGYKDKADFYARKVNPEKAKAAK